MRRLVVVGCGLLGCATAPVVASEPRDDDIAVTASAIPRAKFSVVGAELGDPAVLDRIRARTRIVRYGRGSPRADGELGDRHSAEMPWLPVLPVIGETSERIRVVATDDHARVAMWIERADVAPTVRADVQLADERGRAARAAGVWLDAGAPIELARSDALGGMQRIALRDRGLRAGGWVAKQLIGDVWVVRADERRPTAVDDASWFDTLDTGDASVLAGAIRVAPRGDAKVIAEAIEPVGARIVRRTAEWAEVEVRRPYARIVGFVPASRIAAGDRAVGHGGGTGSGFGMSDTARLEVPPGTCLYDEQGDEVVGVNLERESRYRAGAPHDGWWGVVVGTRWGTMRLSVHDLSGTRDPAQVRLETCRR